ncbi:MAG: hypothetical protein R3F11_17045 [Verrucomicrobiales bacterium]
MTTEREVGFRDAKRKPFLAAQRFLDQMWRRRRRGSRRARRVAEDYGVIFLPTAALPAHGMVPRVDEWIATVAHLAYLVSRASGLHNDWQTRAVTTRPTTGITIATKMTKSRTRCSPISIS